MSTPKTVENDNSVEDFLNRVENNAKRADGFALLELFKDTTGEQPKMWGTSIIGFGKYYYKSERSRQEGDWPLTGFSPRKQNLTIYIMDGFDSYRDLLNDLGKHKISKSCLYINALRDIDIAILRKLIHRSYNAMTKRQA